MWSFSTHLLTPDRESTTDQSVELGELMSFIGDTYRDTSEELFIGAEMTQRQLHHQSPPPHGCQFTKSGKPGAHVYFLLLCVWVQVWRSGYLARVISFHHWPQIQTQVRLCAILLAQVFCVLFSFLFNGGSYRLKTLFSPFLRSNYC